MCYGFLCCVLAPIEYVIPGLPQGLQRSHVMMLSLEQLTVGPSMTRESARSAIEQRGWETTISHLDYVYANLPSIDLIVQRDEKGTQLIKTI